MEDIFKHNVHQKNSLPVFRWYKAKFGNLRVKQKYEIPPEENIKIPPELFKSNKLGRYVDTIRVFLRGTKKHKRIFHPEDIAELLKMGYFSHLFSRQ